MTAVADVNLDGKPDLVTTQYGVGTPFGPVLIFLGNGDGTFRAPLEISSVQADEVVLGDLNLDGIPDLMADNVIFLGNGDGSFREVSTIYPIPLTYLLSVIADFNGDGIPDIASIGSLENNVVWINFGNGDGTFSNAAAPLGVGTGDNPAAFVYGTFHKGGKAGFPDIVTANIEDGTVSILLNTP